MIVEYKEAGITINQFIEIMKIKYPGQKIAYAGRLDPMARGLVPILFNEECNMMDRYTSMNKTYRVKVIVGVQTDSDDPLGIIQNNMNYNLEDIILKYSDTLTKPCINFNQLYHYFSTKEINRRRKNKNLHGEPTSHITSLYSSTIISTGSFDTKEWVDKVLSTIDSIDKTLNFRQIEIIKQWANFSSDSIQYIELELNVSSGFFVRQFIRDTSNTIGIPLMCYDIHRIII
jgi:tRNA U55 pseudouridine synthase TruB